jgi:hypothetical protein
MLRLASQEANSKLVREIDFAAGNKIDSVTCLVQQRALFAAGTV